MAGLIEKYVEIENTQLNTDSVNDIKERTKNTLYGLSNAYTEQFEKLINDQLLDMGAELKVMENTIKADGFDVKKQDRTQEIKSGFSAPKPPNKINCWRSRNFIWRFWRT